MASIDGDDGNIVVFKNNLVSICLERNFLTPFRFAVLQYCAPD